MNAMADFVVRGIDAEKYRKFRAVLVARDETLGEWLEKRMTQEIAVAVANEPYGSLKITSDVELEEG